MRLCYFAFYYIYYIKFFTFSITPIYQCVVVNFSRIFFLNYIPNNTESILKKMEKNTQKKCCFEQKKIYAGTSKRMLRRTQMKGNQMIIFNDEEELGEEPKIINYKSIGN